MGLISASKLLEAEAGMLVVETIAKIRRAYFRQGKAIKAICRELGVSRKVVRKVIRTGATEFRYEREDQPLPRIGRWRGSCPKLWCRCLRDGTTFRAMGRIDQASTSGSPTRGSSLKGAMLSRVMYLAR
jgi:hypothetical protein